LTQAYSFGAFNFDSSGNLLVTSSGGGGSSTVSGTGTAGTPATGVITVQGITSGTPVAATLPANQSVNVTQVGGAALALGQAAMAASVPAVLPVLQVTAIGTAVATALETGPAAPSASIPVTNACATSTPTQPTIGTTDTLVLAANAARKGATVYNSAANPLLLLLNSATATSTVYTLSVAAGGYYEVPFGYTGALRGLIPLGAAAVQVTEFTV